MADSYVCSGAMMKCTMGTSPAKLTVLPIRMVHIAGQPQANISDHVSMVNLAPFGLCRSLAYPLTASATAAALGTLTPMPCQHNTPVPWLGGKMDKLIQGQPALLKSSKCQCMWGGTISLITDGQVGEGTQYVQKKQGEDFELQQQENSGLDQNSVLDGIQIVQREPVTKRVVKSPTKPKGIEKFDPATASNLEKGNFGEIVSHENKVNNPLLKEKGYDLERIGNPPPSGLADKGHKGIDGIYKNRTPPPDYIIDEAKYGSSRLSNLDVNEGTKQMSDKWIKGGDRLNDSVGRIEAKKIKKALRRGKVDRVLSKVDENGNVTTIRLDKNGNEIGQWP